MRNTLRINRLARNPLIALMVWLLLVNGAAIAEDMPQVKFTVKQFVLEGQNPLPEKITRKLLKPYLGEHEGLTRIEQASKDLEQALHAKGHAFHRVIVPPQKITGGVIKLQVLAFKLDQILVEGNQHFSNENILASIPCLRRGQTPNTLEIARSLLVANEHPAKRVAVFIRNSETPGSINARVEARDIRPYQVFASLANTGEAETGRTRLTMGAQHSNLFKRDHVMTLSYTTSPEYTDDVNQGGVNYRLPVYGLGAVFSLFYIHSEVDNGLVANFFEVSGKGKFAGIGCDFALSPKEYYSHKLRVDFQDRLFENDTNFSGTPIGVDVRSRPLSVRYSGLWEKAEHSAGLQVEYACNIGSGTNNDPESYTASRADSDRNWDALRFGADLSYSLPQKWSLHARLAGQMANEPLISGEQFGLGGARSVRGFEEREVSGDNGQQLNVEIWTPALIYDVRFLGFFDAGWSQLEKPHPGLAGSETLNSVGAGLRWQWKTWLNVSLDAAVVTNGTEITHCGYGKLHFNVFCRF